MTSDTATATEALAELTERRAVAQVRVDQVEREEREAGAARETARIALVEAERQGVSASRRAKLEAELERAEGRCRERWSERREGALAALRDRQREVRAHTAANLDALVAGLEAEGEVAATAVNEAASALVEAFTRREQIASEIAMLVQSAGSRVEPGGIVRSRADQVASMAATLVREGGEAAPRLRRDPRLPVHGAPVESASAA